MMKNLNRIKIFLIVVLALVLFATGNVLGQSDLKVSAKQVRLLDKEFKAKESGDYIKRFLRNII